MAMPAHHILSALVGHASQHAIGARCPYDLIGLLLVRQVHDTGVGDVFGQHGHVGRDKRIGVELVGVLAQLRPARYRNRITSPRAEA